MPAVKRSRRNLATGEVDERPKGDQIDKTSATFFSPDTAPPHEAYVRLRRER